MTSYCQLRGGNGIGSWWDKKIGRTEDGMCLKCGEEAQTPDHVVFRSFFFFFFFEHP